MNTEPNFKKRKKQEAYFRYLCFIATWSTILLLGVLAYHIVHEGLDWLSLKFFTNFQSRSASKSGIIAGIAGSLYLVGLTGLISIPFGVATAVFLEEYPIKSKWGRIIDINIANLAGVPSIVYGLLGLTIFVRWMGMGQSLIAGAMTMSLVILPVIIVTTRESIRAVPLALRMAGFGMGARPYQVIWGLVLPAAMPGMMTGIILALSRAIGETAPLVVIGALSYVSFLPTSINDEFTVMPVMIYNWASRPQEDFHGLAAGGIIVLLGLMFTMNILAIWIRARGQKASSV
jgi:phosphate transport system permease protein